MSSNYNNHLIISLKLITLQFLIGTVAKNYPTHLSTVIIGLDSKLTARIAVLDTLDTTIKSCRNRVKISSKFIHIYTNQPKH